MPRQRKQALPFRLSYLDTEVLNARLLAIYHSEDEFTLQISGDRLYLHAAFKLTKDQIKQLHDDRSVYYHHEVPGEEYYVGASTEQ